jgi:uncharacterized membrane protein YhaH (DUF805 family)
MGNEIKQRVMQTIQKMWGGRASRLTFLLGTAFYVALVLAVWAPAEMAQFVAPQLLWELYLTIMVAVTLGSVLGICRLYVQRLHDMGLSGYWAFISLAAGPTALLYLSDKYGSWRWQSDNTFPTGQLNESVGYVVLAVAVIFSLFRGSDQDNKFGSKPVVISLPQYDFQMRWTAIAIAIFSLPYFTYLGFFNDKVWVGRTSYSDMPMASTNAAGSSFMRCWGFKGVGAYWNDENRSKDSLFTFDNGFTKDGYGEDIFVLYVDDAGSIDIVTGGKNTLSYKEDGFNVSLINPNNIDFKDYDWYKSPSAKTFIVNASSYNSLDQVQNETSMSFIRTDEYGNYMAIFTKNFMRGSEGMVGPYINGQVMIGNCKNY